MPDARGNTVTVRIARHHRRRRRHRVDRLRPHDHVPRLAGRLRLRRRRRRRGGRRRHAPSCPTLERGPGAARPRSSRPTATPPSRPPATPRPRSSRRSRRRASAARPPTRRSCRRSRTAATCGRRARPSSPPPTRSRWCSLLEQHFSHLVDYEFTARMEDDLDEIAGGRQQRVPWLHQFWFGNGTPGVKGAEGQGARGGRRRGDQHDPARRRRRTASRSSSATAATGPTSSAATTPRRVPDDLPLDELTIDRAVEILVGAQGRRAARRRPATGLPVFAKSGRFGPYVQLGDADTLPPDTKPKMSSLFQTMSLVDDHARRGPPAAAAAADRRRRTPTTARRSSPPTAATARSSSGATRPAASTPRSSCSPSPSTRP